MSIQFSPAHLRATLADWSQPFNGDVGQYPEVPQRRLHIKRLEDRILMSASPAAAEAPLNVEATEPIDESIESLPNADAASSVAAPLGSEQQDQDAEIRHREIVFVDPAADAQQLVDDLLQNQNSNRGFEVFLLDGSRDGIQQITERLAGFTDLDAIHIVSHGSDGEVALGNVSLNATSLTQYAGAIASWSGSLSETADLLLYGCDVASSPNGQTLVQSLSALTGADVAASTDDTGHTALGGDWELEFTSGVVGTSNPFSVGAQLNWLGLLDTVTGLLGQWDVDSDGSDSSGNGLGGPLVGDATIDTNIATNIVGSGKLALDGDNDYLDLSAHSATLGTLSEGTIAGWVRTTQTTGSQTLFGVADHGDAFSFASFGVYNGKLFFDVAEGGYLFTSFTDADVADGNWHHVAVTVDSFGNNLYIDGAQIAATNINYGAGNSASSTFFLSDVGNVDSIFIGVTGESGGYAYDFNGLIDDVRVYDRALTPTDVTELYAMANVAPLLDNTQNLALDTIQKDESPTRNDGNTILEILTSDTGNPITDPDGALLGIAITSVDDSNGVWEYSIDDGANWNAIDPDNTGPIVIDKSNSLLLEADASNQNRVRFAPNAGYTGSAGNINFRAWDGTEQPIVGSGNYMDIASVGNGGSTPFSADEEQTTLWVNDNPTIDPIVDQPIMVNTTTGLIGFNIGDDLDVSDDLVITVASSNTTVVPLAAITVTGSGSARNVEVTPAANEIGASVVTLTVTDLDGAESYASFLVLVAPHVVTVDTINDIDDAPDMTDIAHLLYNPGTDGQISLREAIIATNNTTNAIGGPDQIILPSGSYVLSQGAGDNASLSGDLDFSDDVLVTGGGTRTTTVDGDNLDKVLDILAGETTITDLTIRQGNSAEGALSVAGGATLNLADVTIRDSTGTTNGGGGYIQGTLNLDGVTVANNSADFGGGIHFFNADGGSLTNVTISGNTAVQDGGGLWSNSVITITNSTIADNTATTGDGDGIFYAGGSITIANSILANDGVGSVNSNAALSSGDYNIDSDGTAGLTGPNDSVADPLINFLGNNGGPTDTHALTPGSSAINPAGMTGAPLNDQRGFSRVLVPDIGAFESPFIGPTLTSFAGVVETTLMNVEVEVTFAELAALGDENDVDGTVDAFIVKSILAGSTLRIGTSAGTATPWVAGTNDTIDATHSAFWVPPTDTAGTLDALSVIVQDNDGLQSSGNTPAQIDVQTLLTLWSITGDATVVESGTATYALSLSQSLPIGDSASIDLTLTDLDTNVADHDDFVTAVNNAVASRPDLTFDGTTLTYTASNNYDLTYAPTGGTFNDISGSGVSLPIGDEDNAIANIGFGFEFYGTNYSQLYVHDNGYVTFGSGINNQYNNADISSGTELGGRPAIAIYWDDLDPDTSGDIYVQTIGVAGSREFIIQWDGVPYYGGGNADPGTMQIVLKEATGEIEFRYDDTDFANTGHDHGSSATIGIQDGSGSATQFSHNMSSSVTSGSTLTFTLGTGAMTPLNIDIAATDDNAAEVGEDYRINLANPTGSALSPTTEAMTTILDNDTPIATNNTNSVTEDVVLVATGNAITDDDGFGVDWVNDTQPTSTLAWSDEFADGDTMSPVVIDGVLNTFTANDPDGIGTIDSFKAYSTFQQGGQNSLLLLQVDPPDGFGSSRIDFQWTFGEPVRDLEFELLDFDDGIPNWGDDVVITAFNGATPVPVTIIPNDPSRYVVSGGHIRSIGGAVNAASTDGNITIQVNGHVTSVLIDYGYTADVTNTNPLLQQMAIGDINWRRANSPIVGSVETETDENVDVVGSYGTLDWSQDGSYTYHLDNTNTAVQALGSGEIVFDTFDYTIVDVFGATDTATVTIAINGTNDQSVVDLNDNGATGSRDFATTFTEGDPAVGISAVDATISDLDGDEFTSLSVTLNGFVDGSSEQLLIGSSSLDIGTGSSQVESFGGTDFRITYDGATSIVITDDGSGTMSASDVTQLIRAISYQNVSPFPTEGDRLLNFAANDGFANSNTAISTITLSRNAESAEWSLIGSASVNEGSNAGYTVALSDPMRNGETASVMIGLTDTSSSTSDHASFAAAMTAAVGAYTGPGSLAFNAGTGQLTFTSDGTGKMTDLIVSLAINNDTFLEPDEIFSVSLASSGSTTGQTITIDVNGNAVSTTINDSTTATATVSATDANAAESGSDPGQFIVDLGAINETGSGITVNYVVGGGANAGTDYSSLSGAVTIAIGNQTALIDVLGIVDDNLVESDETVVLTLSGASHPAVSIDTTSATLTIADNDGATVAIVATTGGDETGPVNGVFTLTQTAVSSVDTVLNYTVTGSATSGSDFTPLSGTVTIGAGTTTATIDVSTIDDALIEATEDVTVTLNTIASGDPQVTIDAANNSDTLTIADNDGATVAIVATTGGDETGPVNGVFTLTQTAVSSVDTVLSYTVTGSATSGSDFTPLSGTVTIGAGTTTATIDVSTIDDALIEATEDVTVTLNTITSGDPQVTIDAANNSDTLTIADNDGATVAIAGTTSGDETGPVNGVFTLTQTAVSSVDTVLSYTVTGSATSGSDFTPLSGTVTIGAGTTTATIDVSTIDDALIEATEDVTVTLNTITSGDPQVTIDAANNSDTLTIADNDGATVAIAGTTSGDETGPVNGVFTLTQTAVSSVDTVLNYTVTGSATSGSDFTPLSGTVTIGAGTTTATIDVSTIDDALIEATEDVTVTLNTITSGDPQVTIDAANNSDTLTIADNDGATVAIAGTTSGDETGPVNGVFTLTQTAVSSVDTVLNYTVTGSATSGSDFTPLSGTVTIGAGTTTATIDVSTIDDALIEATEDVTVTLNTITSGDPQVTIDAANNSDTLTIADNDGATVAIAGTTSGDETGPVNGVFTLTQTAVSSVDTVLNYTVTGSATSGSDFTPLSGTVTIGAGTTTATIDVSTIDDALIEATEDVTVTLNTITSGDPQVTIDAANNSDTLTIADNDGATVAIAGTTSGDETGPVNGVFTLTQTAVSSVDTVLNYTVTGSATSGSDFTPLSGTVTIGAGITTATIDVSTIDDALIEATEDVTVTLNTITSGDPQVTIDAANNSDTLTIADNDGATVAIVATTGGDETGPVNGVFTLTQTAVSSVDTVLSYTVTGSATSGSDFTPLSGTVTIGAGTTTATIDVSTIDDALIEATEDVTVTLNTITSGDPQVTIDAANNSDTLTIADNDGATVAIAGTTSGDETGPVNGVFTLTQTAVSSVDTVLSYTVTGSATSGSDFTPLSGTVTIGAGTTTATIDVSTIDDALIEATEDVTVTLNTITSGDPQVTIDAANNSDTLTIADNDGATVAIAGTTSGDETGPVNGVFTLTQTAVSSVDTVLSYTVTGSATSGSDFTPLSGTVTIGAGTTTATIDVSTIDDALIEATEDVTVTLNTITSGDPQVTIDAANNSDTLTIADNDGGINNVPVVIDHSFTINEDTSLNVSANGVLSGSTDLDGDSLVATLANGPSHGTVVVNLDGSFDYIPNANYYGIDTFSYFASDGTDISAPGIVTITIRSVNDAPVAFPNTYTTFVNDALVVGGSGVLTDDIDVDGDPLTATLITNPANGIVNFNTDGSFSYAPAPSFFGTDSFTYLASDGTANSEIVTVTINVEEGQGFIPPEVDPQPETPDPNPTDPQDPFVDPPTPVIKRTETPIDGTSFDRSEAFESRTRRFTPIESTYEQISFLDRQQYDWSLQTSEGPETEINDAAEPYDLFETNVLWKSMDNLGAIIAKDGVMRTLIAGSAFLFAAIGSVAYVIWTVWGGYLLSSMVALMPHWQLMDPLPVLDDEADETDPQDDESLASIATRESAAIE